jgi:hypothetical protein
MYNTIELKYSGDATAVRPSDGKARINVVTSTYKQCLVVYCYWTILATIATTQHMKVSRVDISTIRGPVPPRESDDQLS